MHYYESEDLKRFSGIRKVSEGAEDEFFSYYNKVTAEDGSLKPAREVSDCARCAHSRQCPYCIDAYTVQCLESGASPEQMTEAVHVAAAMEAGMTLVHGIQMHNTLDRVGG